MKKINQKIKNDIEFSIKVDSLKNTHTYAKAGLMIRRNLYGKSSHGIINLFQKKVVPEQKDKDKHVISHAIYNYIMEKL